MSCLNLIKKSFCDRQHHTTQNAESRNNTFCKCLTSGSKVESRQTVRTNSIHNLISYMQHETLSFSMPHGKKTVLADVGMVELLR